MSLARHNDKILPASNRPAPKLASGLKSVSLFLEVNNKQLSESSKKVCVFMELFFTLRKLI